ncbi:hypothetical protein POSPLADRAFT_1158354, partial [Postia placenta MAD-698-R-SB12]
DPRGQERARKLGRASSRGPEAPIVVYNDPARSRGQTRSPRRRTGCSNTPPTTGSLFGTRAPRADPLSV